MNQVFDIYFEGSVIPLVESNKMLGVEVDNKLTFGYHIDQICANSKRSINTISALNKLRIDLLVRLYKILSRSRLEYATSVWGFRINKGNNRSKLESVQRQALLKILNAPPSTPTGDMEVELDIIPVDLRLNELQRKESYKIFLKDEQDPTRPLLENAQRPLGDSFKGGVAGSCFFQGRTVVT